MIVNTSILLLGVLLLVIGAYRKRKNRPIPRWATDLIQIGLSLVILSALFWIFDALAQLTS